MQHVPAAERLRRNRDAILEDWLGRVRKEVHGPSDASLINSVPSILEGVAVALETGSVAEGIAHAVRHADDRSNWSSYSLGQLLREYRLLRQAILAGLDGDDPLSSDERELILDCIDAGAESASTKFIEIQQLHDRLESQYLKLLEKLASESASLETLGETLQKLLEVVTGGMGAQASALLLYQANTVEIRIGSALGASPELATMYRAALTVSKLAGPSIEPHPNVVATDVETLEPDARDALRRLDIAFLLRVPLPIGAGFPGTLILGFAEKRQFDRMEIHLLEVLGQRLAVFLSRAQIYEQAKLALTHARETISRSESSNARLQEEARERERALAEITHDLRSPLSVAKTGAELIRRTAATPAAESLAARILRSIDRSDKMIADLLDVYRVRAGKPLAMIADYYYMGELAEEVLAEKTLVHGDRFRPNLQPDVLGYWSREGMRRVLENLLDNAVKYSPPMSPITVDVRKEDSFMVLSVHNEGQPMSAEDQERVLKPFERGALARGHAGWGIGLTLIRGIVSAHGGTLHVDSSPGGGTTFTIRNPMDSRPFLSVT